LSPGVFDLARSSRDYLARAVRYVAARRESASSWTSARACRATSGGTDYIEADLYDPGAPVSISRTKLDFGQPVAIMP